MNYTNLKNTLKLNILVVGESKLISEKYSQKTNQISGKHFEEALKEHRVAIYPVRTHQGDVRFFFCRLPTIYIYIKKNVFDEHVLLHI